MKSFLVVAAAALAVVAAQASPAAAAQPCGQAVIDDWWDGHIDHTYAKHCYTDAIRDLPTDAKYYSNADSEIRAAMLAALSRGNGTGDPPAGQSSNDTRSPQNATSTEAGGPEKASKSAIAKSIDFLGPSNAASVPLPLLVLAGVAFLLLAAAGGSFLNRRLQTRRLPPSPQA